VSPSLAFCQDITLGLIAMVGNCSMLHQWLQADREMPARAGCNSSSRLGSSPSGCTSSLTRTSGCADGLIDSQAYSAHLGSRFPTACAVLAYRRARILRSAGAVQPSTIAADFREQCACMWTVKMEGQLMLPSCVRPANAADLHAVPETLTNQAGLAIPMSCAFNAALGRILRHGIRLPWFVSH
jgi:hypothetical protein